MGVVDLILVVCSWIVWRGGGFPRGRPLTAMLTVAMGVPLQFILWYGIEPGSALNNVWVFFLIQALFNLTAVWAQPGCNFPVLGQIVTGKDRNKVMCWEMAFEN